MNDDATAPTEETPAPQVDPDEETLQLIHHDPVVTFDEFGKLDIRVAEVLEAAHHPDADRLFLLKVKTGPEEVRQLVAGIRGYYEAEQLVGRKLVVLCNLKPAKIRGQWSNGMILAAGTEDRESVKFLTPESDIPAGSAIS
jgi:methionyl-tRNA synthetase